MKKIVNQKSYVSSAYIITIDTIFLFTCCIYYFSDNIRIFSMKRIVSFITSKECQSRKLLESVNIESFIALWPVENPVVAKSS